MGKLRATPPDNLTQDSMPQNRLATERLIFFSDAVFAIAITLLVLDIRLPADISTDSNRALFLALTGIWPKYLAFFISFWVIGLFWISHHRKFQYLQRVDYRLTTLNLLLLMMIAFIPFPTMVMSENLNFTATALYAITIILASISGVILWRHATHNHRLVDPGLARGEIRREEIVPFATIGIFTLSIGIAAVSPSLARVCWFLVFPVHLFLRRRVD
jgi:uncharacterized membrane protein